MLILVLLNIMAVKLKLNIFINLAFNVNISFIKYYGGQVKIKYFYKFRLQC